ncbi:energy transducer TonB [Thalassotalea agarivorans]|uniref:TonB protein C-terminal n=1 Tax=Thalassotalea agarivorans TaxID=349064 RepID=A0A1I0CRG4_THASX|nr:energy transducer TonB [Thalassotalea agarivorans]SET22143.1 TonB protein C-terminal [Thalassotalea agarivorans]
MKLLKGCLLTFFITACATSSAPPLQYASLAVTPDLLLSSDWQTLQRFPPRFPKEAVYKNKTGCATVEYVITESKEIVDIQVVAASNKVFGQAAAEVIPKWQWQKLAKHKVPVATKTQTRFDFCYGQTCTLSALDDVCPGKDIVYARGMRMRMN